MSSELMDIIDIGTKLLLPIVSGVVIHFWGEIKDLRDKNEKLREDLGKNAKELQKEISEVKETFVSLETLRETENRITHYFDTRLADVVEKLESKLEIMIQILKSK